MNRVRLVVLCLLPLLCLGMGRCSGLGCSSSDDDDIYPDYELERIQRECPTQDGRSREIWSIRSGAPLYGQTGIDLKLTSADSFVSVRTTQDDLDASPTWTSASPSFSDVVLSLHTGQVGYIELSMDAAEPAPGEAEWEVDARSDFASTGFETAEETTTLEPCSGDEEPPPSGDSDVVHVDDDAPPGGDGVSWATAFRHLRDAITTSTQRNIDADPDNDVSEIRIAAGLYRPDESDHGSPDPATRRDLEFLVHRYTWLGGYDPATGTRDPAANPTVLSGDLDGNDPGAGPIGSADPERLENAYNVILAQNLDGDAVIDGFVIEGGHADGTGNATFGSTNTGAGALASGSGSVTFRNCVFRRNFALRGAGVRVEGETLARFESCRFEDNHTTIDGAGAWFGPGVLDIAQIRLEECDFVANRARFGGGAWVSCATELVSCRFLGNSDGIWAPASSIDTTMHLDLVNCEFVGNSGPGAYVSNFIADLAGSTFHGNGAAGLQVDTFSDTAATIRDSILFGNSDPAGATREEEQVRLLGGGTADVRYALIEGFDPSTTALTEQTPGHVLTADPLFVDPDGADGQLGTDDDDLSLAPGSPARDAAEDGGHLGAVR